jgi:hypothetical protein
VAAAGALPALLRLAHRSGVSAADVARPLPGDDLIADPDIQIDRAAAMSASAEAVWPWLVQLGKDRAGWYMPAWLERVVVWPTGKRSARRIVDELQSLAPGDLIPDWGPGDPSFKAIQVDPPRALVYLSARDRENGWRWPSDDAAASAVLAFSWALVLHEIDGGSCRLQIRLRGRFGRRGSLRPLLMPLGGLFDYLTIAVLFAGLKQRLAAPSLRRHSR